LAEGPSAAALALLKTPRWQHGLRRADIARLERISRAQVMGLLALPTSTLWTEDLVGIDIRVDRGLAIDRLFRKRGVR